MLYPADYPGQEGIFRRAFLLFLISKHTFIAHSKGAMLGFETFTAQLGVQDEQQILTKTWDGSVHQNSDRGDECGAKELDLEFSPLSTSSV